MNFPITRSPGFGFGFVWLGYLRKNDIRLRCLIVRWTWRRDTRVRLIFNLTFWRKCEFPFYAVAYRAGSELARRKCGQHNLADGGLITKPGHYIVGEDSGTHCHLG